MRNILLTIIIFLPLHLCSQVIHVPLQYTTIQAAINAASSGDTVLVSDGVYYENIRFMGKAITVGSEYITNGDTSHISQTIIDGSQPSQADSSSVVYFVHGEDTGSIIQGFTIRGGNGTRMHYNTPIPYTNTLGGGIHISGSGAKVISNRITGNQVTGDTASGGGLFHTGDSLNWLVLRGNRIENNSSNSEAGLARGGGIASEGNIFCADNSIQFNECTNTERDAQGGGIWIAPKYKGSNTISISDNIIHQNIVEARFLAAGGGITAIDCKADINGNTISANTSTSQEYLACGGGIAGQRIHSDSASLNLQGNEIDGNAIQGGYAWGGGIYAEAINLSLLSNGITGNVIHAFANAMGGGIYLIGQNKAVDIISNTISGNTTPVGISLSSGGGLCIHDLYGIRVKVDRNSFSGNEAHNGGGAYFRSTFDLLLSNNIFSGDSAFTGGGLMIEHPLQSVSLLSDTSVSPHIINNTFYNNAATSYGGGFRYTGHMNTPSITNSIFWENRAVIGNDIRNASTDEILVQYSDIDPAGIHGNYGTYGNIYADPLFPDAANGNFLPAYGSPCIDAGASGTGSSGLPGLEVDFFGNPRNLDNDLDGDSIVDMGAIEVLAYTGTRPSREPMISSVYPNPFSHETTIEYMAREKGMITFRVHDPAGRLVHTEMQEVVSGLNRMHFSSSGLPAGIYYFILQSVNQTSSGKMMLIR